MATRNVKPLIKDYKAALVFLAKREGIEVKYTKSGALSIESVGYLKGFVGCKITATLPELLEHWIDCALNIPISATNLALYFRNEREMIKNDDQRMVVCSEFHNAFLNTISDSVIEECEEVDEDEETEDSGELETYDDVSIENPPEDEDWEPTISQEEADQALSFWRESGMF